MIARLRLATIAALVALGVSRPANAQVTPRADAPRLISTDTLAAWLDRGPVRVLDVRADVFTYLKDHLPDAAYLNLETLRATRRGLPTQLLDPTAYRGLFSRLGIRLDRPVVLYSAGETRDIDATFVAWLIAGFGHRQVYLLDGGYYKWALEQRRLAKEYPRFAPASGWNGRPFRPETASLDDVRGALASGKIALVDARPPDQFAGEAGAQMRRGHIPGALNHYWANDLTQEGFGHVWRSVDTLRARYAEQGITPDRPVIAYCNSATEASHVFFALKYLLGYRDVRIFVGSWTEWAERTELPIETGGGGRAAAGR